MSTSPVNILMIGSGMYVCGIGTDGFGTILPSVFEAHKKGLVGHIGVVGHNSDRAKLVHAKVDGLNNLMGLDVSVECYPQDANGVHLSYEELVKGGSYDCAIISIPDHLHFEAAKAVLEAKMHCMVVKPLAPTLEEVDRLIKLQEENGVYCAVEFHKRYDESNLRARKLLREGSIGDLLYVLVEYSQQKRVPMVNFKSWAAESNIFQYLGVHYIDIIYFATGAIPVRVAALAQSGHLRDNGLDVDDAIQAFVEWQVPGTDKTFSSTLLTNWIDPDKSTAMSDQKIKYIGTKGRIECDQKCRGLTVVTDETGPEDINPYFSDFRYDVDGVAMDFGGYGRNSVVQFISDCSTLASNPEQTVTVGGLRAGFSDARISTAVVEAVSKSLDSEGAWVPVNL